MTSCFKPLTETDLDQIFETFVKPKHRVVCKETHIHGFSCVDFDDEQTMIIDRLRIEVLLLQHKLKEISDVLKQ